MQAGTQPGTLASDILWSVIEIRKTKVLLICYYTDLNTSQHHGRQHYSNEQERTTVSRLTLNLRGGLDGLRLACFFWQSFPVCFAGLINLTCRPPIHANAEARTIKRSLWHKHCNTHWRDSNASLEMESLKALCWGIFYLIVSSYSTPCTETTKSLTWPNNRCLRVLLNNHSKWCLIAKMTTVSKEIFITSLKNCFCCRLKGFWCV